MNKGKKVLSIILAIVLSLGFGVLGGTIANDLDLSFGNHKSGGTETTKKVIYSGSGDTIVINVSEDYSLAEAIAEKVMPSVASVSCVYEESFTSFFSGGRIFTQENSCVGTGFVVDSRGYILTNSHVVNDGNYKKIEISLYDGLEIEGNLLWNDSTLDLAVVKIDVENLKAVELGDSDKVKIGSYAAAIGNPLGLTFERSITQGIISGLDRTITVSSSSTVSGTTMEGLFQTDAAINSGNSGGPLLNSKGEVIAVASAKASNGESMGFAIPINVAKPIIAEIIETGYYERVYLGISAIGIEQQSSVSKEALESYYGSSKGIYIASVSKGGGAYKAGLKEGDVILKVNGVEVGTMNKMYSLLVNYKSGDTVEVEFLRDGKIHSAKVVLMTSKELENIAI